MNRALHLAFCYLSLALLSLPAAALAAGDPIAGKGKISACIACHGANGKSLVPTNPNLAGQHASYLIKQLRDYKSGARKNPIMSSFAAQLSEQDMADIAAYYSQQPAVENSTDADDVELGGAIYRGGIRSLGVAACIACHGPKGRGNPQAGWPSLAGQNSAYIEATLKAYRDGTRSNDPAAAMRQLVSRLRDEEIRALSHYIQGLN